ncbi:hypothetical protein BDV38DRAFT_283024 [Aspergillus pseudotamarii]|uniref:Enolase C-terminal domain-containing protein n=1 Tax=Aspergillus pseudotamarii TaxID=132259 RepID=A0A5N6SS18_ASPPS|nr:uncharacterized protein BDV38DRAFT_283024 [Aspergillus pseudotamarii]KAE8137476.1 hypothetical protein BDV38DRAFT_283024 [Aspergillus pseudotamarii]
MAHLVTAYTAGIAGANIKVSRVGGFTKARLLRDAAVALDMMVAIDDTWGCALPTAQNIRMAASTPPNRLRAVDVFAEWTSPALTENPRMKSHGLITHPSLPGTRFGTIIVDILGEPLFYIKA